MQKLTESESKVSRILADILSSSISEEPHLKAMLDNIALTPFTFSDDIPKIIVLSMPLELLQHAKLQYSKIVNALKKEFPNFMILLRRSGEIVLKRGNSPVRSREHILNDLVFPATVSGRSSDVESKTEIKQYVYLDSKNQVWNDLEMLAIERVLCTVFDEDFSLKIFGSYN